MKTTLSSLLFLLTSAVLPSVVVATSNPPICKKGVIKVWPFLTVAEARSYRGNQADKLALKNPKPICQCEDDSDDTTCQYRLLRQTDTGTEG